MSFVDDLAKAQQMFAFGARQLATQQHVSEASEVAQVMTQQLADGTMKDMEYRQKTNQLAKALQANLVGVGADANDIQLAFNAISPKQFGSSLDAFSMGDKGTGKEMLKREQDEIKFKTDEAIRLSQAQFNEKLKIAEAKAGAEKGTFDKNFVQKYQTAENSADLLNIIEQDFNRLQSKVGPMNMMPGVQAWRGLDKDFASFKSLVDQSFDEYRTAVTGAGAGPSEISLLEKRRPSVTDTAEVFRAKLKDQKDIMAIARARGLLNQQKFHGVDLKPFGSTIAEGLRAAKRLGVTIDPSEQSITDLSRDVESVPGMIPKGSKKFEAAGFKRRE